VVTAVVEAPSAVAPRAETPVDVVVVTVTYNSADVIGSFLTALPAALEGLSSAKVVIVDNNSRDNTVEIVHALAPWSEVLQAGRNGGYAAGINLAMRHVSGRRGTYVLNPDAIPSPGSAALLLAAVESQPDVGMATPRLVDGQGRLQYSLRREPTLGRALGEAMLGGRRAARFAALGEVIRDPESYQDGATADWATGAAVFLSAEAVAAVGEWDERFFLYSEETDYALRLRDAGLRMRYVAGATAVHRGGAQSRSPYLWSLGATNRTVLYRKRHGPVSSAAYWASVVANEAARSLRPSRTHRAALRALLRLGPNPVHHRVTPPAY
jgi:N-acetylglucosaminyl-diphospho-decaprenol L-rhamnosyltransferase